MGYIMRKYISALCVGLMILGLFSGCGSKIPVSDVSDDKTTEDNNDGDDVICGGTTTKQDPDAPKEITSKDIVAMDVSFYTEVRWDKEENHDFTFVISEENGELVASEPNIGMSEVADEELLTKLQDVIDDEKLVSRNGLYDVTAGLPPEYQEKSFTVTYESGEELHFTENNNPQEGWSAKFYDIFMEWFASKGDDRLYPEKETSQIQRLSFKYNGEDTGYYFVEMSVKDEDAEDGKKLMLSRSVYSTQDSSDEEFEYATFPDDYYDRVTEIFDKNDVVIKYDFSTWGYSSNGLNGHDEGYFGWATSTDADEIDSNGLLVDIYVEYESGKILNIETRKESEIAAMKPFLDELLEYHNSLYE